MIPVVLFTFNRPEHTRRTLDALAKNPEAGETDLIVFSDGPRKEQDRLKVEDVRTVLNNINGFKSVELKFRSENFGLFKSIFEGISEIFKRHESLIILEDDLVPAQNFLAYMNLALVHYSSNPQVGSVSAFSYPLKEPLKIIEDTFLFPRFSCWGWGIWKSNWEKISWSLHLKRDFLANKYLFKSLYEASNDLPEIYLDLLDKKNSSWSIVVCIDHVLKGQYCVHPVVSKVQNIGFDGSGVHSNLKNEFEVIMDKKEKRIFKWGEQFSKNICTPLFRYFKNSWKRKIKNFLKYGKFF